MLDLSIIIVSWNVADLLAACLDTIIASPIAIDEARDGLPTVEVIVVDSASSDHTVAMLQSNYPQIQLLAQEENVGFTRANNIGLEVAQGRHLLLLNPDTAIVGDALPTMIAYLDANTDVGILGPHTLNSDGSTQSSRRHFPTKATAFFESTWLQRLAPQALLDHYYVRNVPDNAVVDVDWVQGSALMARRGVYEQIGGLDTGYVMFYEEHDWCRHAKEAGWRVVYLGTAQIIHHGGKSTGQVAAQKHIYFQQSKLRYFRKYHGRSFALLLRIFLLTSYLSQIVVEGAKALIGTKRDLRLDRMRVYWQVIRSGLKVT